MSDKKSYTVSLSIVSSVENPIVPPMAKQYNEIVRKPFRTIVAAINGAVAAPSRDIDTKTPKADVRVIVGKSSAE